MVYIYQSKLGEDRLKPNAMRKFGEDVNKLFV